MSPYPFQENEDTNQKEFAYNDYDGYFDNLVTDSPLRLKKNVPVIKNVKKLIDEYFTIVSNEDVERIRKEDIIIEIAQNIEVIYRNSNLDHLVETIASSICLILTKKDRNITPRWIYEVLQKNFKNRYVSYTGADNKNDIHAKRNVVYKEICNSLTDIPEKMKECYSIIEKTKREEIQKLINHISDTASMLYSENNIQYSSILYGIDTTIPKEDTSADNNTSQSYDSETAMSEEQTGSGNPNFPAQKESLYYKRLGDYIAILEKVRENVLRFPPSPKLDKLLDSSLALEIELLMPAVDMKYKRSIPQLDETVRHANIQSLGGASSVMKEKMLIRDQDGDIIDPNDPARKFTSKFHKLAPEQIEIRKGYISNIRKKMASYCPHIYYNILWYEGSDLYEHNLSMGMFSRTSLKKS